MKTVLLAGGLGTRLSELTIEIPKPMVEIGAMPMLWHIMKCYDRQGFKEFVVALGYKQQFVKDFFIDYSLTSRDISIDTATGIVRPHNDVTDDWVIHMIDTGRDTQTGGRVLRLRDHLDGETFMLTYGDGVSDVDIRAVVDFHRKHGRIATITAVRPPARFGGLVFDGDLVAEFNEKRQIDEGWINGGFMVLEPAVFDYITGDGASLESDTLEALARDGQLAAYRHDGFWQCMDTLRDVRYLNKLHETGAAPWLAKEENKNDESTGNWRSRIHWLGLGAKPARTGT
jgi:glucose-1-phosphate cytidylyltransferase